MTIDKFDSIGNKRFSPSLCSTSQRLQSLVFSTGNEAFSKGFTVNKGFCYSTDSYKQTHTKKKNIPTGGSAVLIKKKNLSCPKPSRVGSSEFLLVFMIEM